ncbi:MAG: FixH family protein [Rhodocyclaceae bacterium]|nr:FixH family protein [Rhodocyclaceae bacterium]MCA3077118.1 FixH family protein [Rhodocyclaceae bacterium]MCA3092178.1 FixH family protein [Rhodocyclaceae bacterium]MCA3095374.1 FixH family protein [Rhodocyclaceae bacterium]MCA3096586.1 FixH family protein [Rhodocyclaceae bacterium]
MRPGCTRLRQTRAQAVVAAAATAFALASGAAAQPAAAPAAKAAGDCSTGLPGGARTASANYTIAWRADPQKIPVGRHFSVDILVCAKAGAAVATAVAIDARMPSHGHGMNYKPTLKPVGENRYRAEGLMFHMPGQWEMVFDLRAGDTVERATQVMMVR